MKTISILFALLFGSLALAQTPDTFWDSQKLQNSKVCLLQLVRSHLNIKNPSPLIPELKLESTTSLKDFQDAMEIWWHFRPDVFTNVYDVEANTIYLSNNLKLVEKNRTPVDSLVHELTHFVQIRDLGQAGNDEDQLESDAVKVQTWFRENYSKEIVDQAYRGACREVQ